MADKVEINSDNKDKLQKEFKAKVDHFKTMEDVDLIELAKKLIGDAPEENRRKFPFGLPGGIIKWWDKKGYITAKQKNALSTFASKHSPE